MKGQLCVLGEGEVAHRKLRIGIDGVQSTGKTHLWRAINATLGDTFRFIPEASRNIAPEFGVKSALDWPSLLEDRKRLWQFFRAEEEWVISRQEMPGSFIVDSSLLVVAAYEQHFLGSSEIPRKPECEYDLILYCPTTEIQLDADGFRFLQSRGEIDAEYRRLASSARIKKLVALKGGSDRVMAAIRAISELVRRDSPGDAHPEKA